jgi:hypothetical protein
VFETIEIVYNSWQSLSIPRLLRARPVNVMFGSAWNTTDTIT